MKKRMMMTGLLFVAVLPLSQCRTVETKPKFRPDVTYEPPRTTGKRSSAVPGRYVGYYRPAFSEFKIPMVFDLIAEKTKGEVTRYRGFAKFSLGDFDSDEFRVEHYQQMVLNHKSGKISVNSSQNQLEISGARLKAGSIITGKVQEQGQNMGDFLVIYSGNRKRIKAEELVVKVFPKRKVLPGLKGSYVGICNQKSASLDVASVRWFQDESDASGFLKHYKVHSRLGIENDGLCGGAKFCAKTNYSETIVDANGGSVKFISDDSKSLTCSVSPTELTCDHDCSFTRQGKSSKDGLARVLNRQERQDRLAFSRETLLRKNIDFEGAVNGEYFGFLFNETTLKHQFFRLKVDAEMMREPGMGKESPVIAGIGTMFYGDGSNNEFSVNKFRGEFFSETGPQFVFVGNGDQVIQVTKWGQEGMRAILYSKSFGRVGTMELARQTIPPLPEGADTVNQLTGVYAGPQHRFTILAQPNVSESNANFFPLLVRGYAQEATNLERKIIVHALSYDSYTGQFGMLLEDGRMITGREASEGFELTWNNKFSFGMEYVQSEPAMFQFMKESTPGKTATNVLDAVHPTEKY